ncbi:ribonuclease [Devosia sp. 2618]|uniref:ribonuclease T2 family protein n=1 Tax=Devosia sp. 2618 TaxID=3156454 RepID=UPI003397D04F
MRHLLALLVLAFLAVPASAQVPMSSSFVADKACPAFQSINRQTNPGNVTLKPGESYRLIAANKAEPTHFQLVIPGASPDQRWVAVDCGRDTAGSAVVTPTKQPAPAPAYRGTQYILAVNWQPAFCELSPRKRECRNQQADDFEATNFTLHGLWPQPRNNQFCGVTARERMASEGGNWFDLPDLGLSRELRAEVDMVMPGSLSGLDRHEWTKHGTCYSASPETYYTDAMLLMTALNDSRVAELFASNIGRKITLRQVRQAFDDSFGRGAGDRVSMDCAPDGNRIIITELSIGITGDIRSPDDFDALILAADPVNSGCSSGLVDAVGLR